MDKAQDEDVLFWRGDGGVPELQVPERGVVAEPGVGQLGRGHEGVVLHVLLSVADQTDRETKTGRSGRSQTYVSSCPGVFRVTDRIRKDALTPSGPH